MPNSHTAYGHPCTGQVEVDLPEPGRACLGHGDGELPAGRRLKTFTMTVGQGRAAVDVHRRAADRARYRARSAGGGPGTRSSAWRPTSASARSARSKAASAAHAAVRCGDRGQRKAPDSHPGPAGGAGYRRCGSVSVWCCARASVLTLAYRARLRMSRWPDLAISIGAPVPASASWLRLEWRGWWRVTPPECFFEDLIGGRRPVGPGHAHRGRRRTGRGCFARHGR